MLFKVSTPVLIVGAVAVYFLFFKGNNQSSGGVIGGGYTDAILRQKNKQEPTNYGL